MPHSFGTIAGRQKRRYGQYLSVLVLSHRLAASRRPRPPMSRGAHAALGRRRRHYMIFAAIVYRRATTAATDAFEALRAGEPASRISATYTTITDVDESQISLIDGLSSSPRSFRAMLPRCFSAAPRGFRRLSGRRVLFTEFRRRRGHAILRRDGSFRI